MTVLVIAAHPDDEILGAGGTMARHARAGEKVHIVFLADGISSRGSQRSAIERRAAAASRAAEALGAQVPQLMGWGDNRLDGIELLDLVQPIEQLVNDIRPDTIYTHHYGDLNIDHAICHRVALTACRPFPGQSVRRIYAMETASSTEWSSLTAANVFSPTRFVDVSATYEAKQRALEAYREEMRPFPHPRSFEAIEALARWRGASVGCHLAEAFMVVRDIER
jgi:N-acetylglucosamine malate deacetylase 1